MNYIKSKINLVIWWRQRIDLIDTSQGIDSIANQGIDSIASQRIDSIASQCFINDMSWMNESSASTSAS